MAYLCPGRAWCPFSFVRSSGGEDRSVCLNTTGENSCFGLTKQVFPLVEFFVLSWRNFCFLLMKLLFRLEETFIFCWWNFYFH